jgi:hypothetical protein
VKYILFVLATSLTAQSIEVKSLTQATSLAGVWKMHTLNATRHLRSVSSRNQQRLAPPALPAFLATITCASRLAPAMLFSMGCGGLVAVFTV